ncbi:hypothetical protein GCM10007923_38150 [Shinella yambaruensis]|uniref:Uncharacterized protein n=1 Tax=Shinella yambaruensis TaxID=415996 RepID=A0ABQ5ZNI7_9HYPH|nr:hypothetical protein GCM10007923_38150 [Shinella yambaruensis]
MQEVGTQADVTIAWHACRGPPPDLPAVEHPEFSGFGKNPVNAKPAGIFYRRRWGFKLSSLPRSAS